MSLNQTQLGTISQMSFPEMDAITMYRMRVFCEQLYVWWFVAGTNACFYGCITFQFKRFTNVGRYRSGFEAMSSHGRVNRCWINK